MSDEPRSIETSGPESAVSGGAIGRRAMLAGAVTAAGAVWAGGRASVQAAAPATGKAVQKGRIKQSVCGWCYSSLKLEQLAAAAAEMGLVGIDLVDPKDFGILKDHQLVGTMTTSHGLTKGLNHPDNHEECIAAIVRGIEATAKEGWRNVICFSGNRNGLDDETGLRNCETALKKVVPIAEKAGVILNMELLNSRVDHADYQCDRSAWGIELVKRVGSDHFKLLYDIYHMQIMEGDVIRTIKDNHKYFGHYHTAGNPGRHEMDDTQELNYRGIVQAIIDTGYDGYLGQEFIPTRDPLVSLREAVVLCDV
ncbi:MAG: TIM barrel protein [Pirellulales bacterium]